MKSITQTMSANAKSEATGVNISNNDNNTVGTLDTENYAAMSY